MPVPFDFNLVRMADAIEAVANGRILLLVGADASN
jgi:hypothetical protein